ncbi:MAG: TonB-dependent receptor [Gemmatimonadota bacterium]|nr:TonB-dependent receptor [Gemmatimonadota bacterium]
MTACPRRFGSGPGAILPLLFFLLALAPTAAVAQGGIVGTVTDEATGSTIASVTVDVVASDGSVVASAVTGPSGTYRIQDVPDGTYTVRFISAGWSTVTVTDVTVTAGQLANASASMSERSFSLNPITVTASKTEEKALDAPAAVDVVQSAEIDARPAMTIDEHVHEKAGVDVIDTGLQGSYVTVRGFNNIFSGATLTMTDNRIARVPSLRANISHLNPTTNLDLERVELVLGPGSALYGPNAANGVIHSITKSPIDYPGASFSVAGGLRQQSDGQGVGGLPFNGSDKGLFHGQGRIAVAPSETFGVKLSGQYFSGTEYRFNDREEAEAQAAAQACIAVDFDLTSPACRAFTAGLDITNPADQATFRRSVQNAAAGRDNDLERWSLDARVDIRPSPETSITLSGGRNQAVSSVDLTGLGAGQVVDWAYNYLQGRLNYKDFFAQVFWNRSDNEDTYLLRSGRPLIDKSSLFVAQLQNATRISEDHRIIYGADLLKTTPDTDGTINGQNEADDEVTEIGGYAQWEWAIDPKWDFVGAVRLDNNSQLEDPVFSPRAALVYKPDLANSFRVTFNRAFSTPTTLNLFLDISGGTLPIPDSPFRYDIRATGSTDVGHMYMRDANGIPMHMSPFNVLLGGTARDFLPTTTPQLWSEAVALIGAKDPSAGQLLGLVAPPSGSDLGIVPLLLNTGVAAGGTPPPGCVAPPFCELIDLASLQDVSRLDPTITNTLEVGYKGLLGGDILLGVNAWWSHITDFTSALRLASPNLFLNGQDVGAYLTQQFLPLVGVVFPDAATAQATAAQLAGTIGQIPLGTVTPQSVGGTTSAMAFVYENLGSVDVFGGELSANFVVSDRFEIGTTLSVVDKDEFESSGDRAEIVPLNAPTVKGTASIDYRGDVVNGSARFRAQNGFPANSGVYIGDVEAYGVLDAGLGFRVPGWEDLWFQLDVQNIFDTSYQTFVGVPELGRMILARVRWDYSPF